MDEFKRTNMKLATAQDYNAKCVRLNDRARVAKMLRRYARRKLKQSGPRQCEKH